MKMIGFHTPELPDPLGLDLAKLHGGGSCPSEFYGETHDGLDVYVRYRGGTLRVHVAHEPGDDALDDGECILEAEIGPPFDGTMSLTQFCTNFGVTVEGGIPEETDPEAHLYANLTGQTTFWKVHLHRITIETSRKIVDKARSAFPNALLVKPIYVKPEPHEGLVLDRVELTTPEKLDTASVYLIDGPSLLTDIEVSPGEGILPKSGQLQISASFSSWQYSLEHHMALLPMAEKELGQTFYVPGKQKDLPKEIELITDSLNMSASFTKDDETTRGKLASLGEAISQLIPPTNLERIELETGNRIDYIDRPIDPVVVEWCKSGQNRWISIMRENRNGPWIGVRPTKR
ncbi:hypothetical protein JANAI62_37280 [Jannaschia pagri]|uniref:Phage tail protein n=1 Tax=Jannaschia pagri TaxID=2829797 RepID=A0ABQ4NRU0_9RHOB|nr:MULTISPECIES: hypothetical protein [unclassified Jannaschia]GIT93321.1 hypothetical protein JANAI61_37790 [Jannaschia sp. AI_61]GIT97105.1 hypothetical protein JANAI62_37280 [Jannaschia sp. AI_62]